MLLRHKKNCKRDTLTHTHTPNLCSQLKVSQRTRKKLKESVFFLFSINNVSGIFDCTYIWMMCVCVSISSVCLWLMINPNTFLLSIQSPIHTYTPDHFLYINNLILTFDLLSYQIKTDEEKRLQNKLVPTVSIQSRCLCVYVCVSPHFKSVFDDRILASA